MSRSVIISKNSRGTVLDPAGAAIPAAIVVVSRGPQDMSIVLRTTADLDGHFSEKLSDGSYIAFFFANDQQS